MALAHSEVKEVLSRTPRTLRCLLDANEGGETFSPHDVLGHLIHGEKTDWDATVRRWSATGIQAPLFRRRTLAVLGGIRKSLLG